MPYQAEHATLTPQIPALARCREPAEHEYCAAAEGLMMCANRVVMDKAAVDSEGKVVLRMLAPSAQMGSVVGVQGRIIK